MNSLQRPGRSAATRATSLYPHGRVEFVDPRLDEEEAAARIGLYVTDLAAGRWASSRRLDANERRSFG